MKERIIVGKDNQVVDVMSPDFLTEEEYRHMKATIEQTCGFISDDKALENMAGYLSALEEVFKPVANMTVYPVRDILETIYMMRTHDATRNELLLMCEEFLKTIDYCMYPFEGGT